MQQLKNTGTSFFVFGAVCVIHWKRNPLSGKTLYMCMSSQHNKTIKGRENTVHILYTKHFSVANKTNLGKLRAGKYMGDNP